LLFSVPLVNGRSLMLTQAICGFDAGEKAKVSPQSRRAAELTELEKCGPHSGSFNSVCSVALWLLRK
jgi:hypothetical protein